MARGVRGRKLEPRVGLALLRDDLHALLPRKMHHRGVLRQAVHEQGLHAPVARVSVGAREKRAAETAAAISRQHGDAKLRVSIAARDVGSAEQKKLFVHDAEYGIAPEIDARD